MEPTTVGKVCYTSSNGLSKIYALVDPNSLHVRYIGSTRQPLPMRLAQHIYDTRNGRGGRKKRRWITRLLEAEQRPIIMELDRCPAEQTDQAERRWIAYYRTRKYKLVNESAGGAGASHRQRAEDRAKRSAGMKAYRASQRTLTTSSSSH